MSTDRSFLRTWLAAITPLSLLVFGTLLLQKAERLVVLAERTADAVAPLGSAAVELGVEAVQSADPEALKDGAAEVLRAARDRALSKFQGEEE